jgi:hypothetical protein
MFYEGDRAHLAHCCKSFVALIASGYPNPAEQSISHRPYSRARVFERTACVMSHAREGFKKHLNFLDSGCR